MHNGSIRNGFVDGIASDNASLVNLRVTDVTVSNVTGGGILLGQSGSEIVTRCAVQSTGGTGIQAGIVSECTAVDCGGTAIVSLIVSNSRGISTGASPGIDAFNVSNSTGSSASGSGISARIARDSIGTSTSGKGVAATLATACIGTSDSANGMEVTIADSSQGTGHEKGIEVRQVQNRTGSASSFQFSARGINATVATGSTGYGEKNIGIGADVIMASYGEATSFGLLGSVVSCSMAEGIGSSGGRIIAEGGVVFACIADTKNDTLASGIKNADGIAAFSKSILPVGATSNTIETGNAIGCADEGGSGIVAPKKFLGTP